MTREEAIKRLEVVRTNALIQKANGASEYWQEEIDGTIEAIDMAIEALQTEPMKCKDCIQKHIGGSVTHYYWCDRWDMEVDETDYCSWGERGEE